ncbi:hypothetical protein [Succinimonas sp.]|uniref:hypothetical protein n=1 Tax=Succinimonas sp. TaxID=1936151 RepID=UPI00386B7947
MSKTNPKIHTLPAAPKQPTEEEIKQQQIRALHQQRCGMAQAFAANICHGTPYQLLTEYGAEEVARFAWDLSVAMMDNFYGKPKEEV